MGLLLELDEEFEYILDNITSDLHDKISSDFNFFNEVINITNFYDFDKSISNLTKDEKINLFIDRIDNKGNNFLTYIFNFIKGKKYKTDFLINTILQMNVDEMNKAREIAIQFSETIKSSYIVTSIKNPYVSWREPNSNEIQELDSFTLEIDNFNNFNDTLYLKGTFKSNAGEGYYLDTFYHYDLYLNCDLYVIDNNHIYDFLIYLIEGFSYLESENYKMCIFHLYSSFDGFIQKIYRSIFNFYVENYALYMDKFVSNLNNLLSNYEISANINNQSYFIEKYKNKLDDHLKGKIRLFANDIKKLESKLNAILLELGIKLKDRNGKGVYCKEYTYLNDSVKYISEMRDYRNDISHADNYVCLDRSSSLKLFYNVLSLMCAISIDQNLIDLFI